MTFDADGRTTSWRDHAIVRVLGSAASWFLFSLSFTLLFLTSATVMGLGGFCANGGAYEIAVECPDSVALFAPLSVYGGLIAVGIALLLAQGFGTPLVVWAWPVLFCGLGAAFLIAGDVVGYVVGGVFVIMGVVPLFIELRASFTRPFRGVTTARGEMFVEPDSARRSLLLPVSSDRGTRRPRVGDWAASLGVLIVFATAGVAIGRVWFGSM